MLRFEMTSNTGMLGFENFRSTGGTTTAQFTRLICCRSILLVEFNVFTTNVAAIR